LIPCFGKRFADKAIRNCKNLLHFPERRGIMCILQSGYFEQRLFLNFRNLLNKTKGALTALSKGYDKRHESLG
jgi:hypothetical protein